MKTTNQQAKNLLPSCPWAELGFSKKPKFKEWVKPESKAEEFAAIKTAFVLTRIQANSKKC